MTPFIPLPDLACFFVLDRSLENCDSLWPIFLLYNNATLMCAQFTACRNLGLPY